MLIPYHSYYLLHYNEYRGLCRQVAFRLTLSLGLCKPLNSYKYPVWLFLASFCEGPGALLHCAFCEPNEIKNLASRRLYFSLVIGAFIP